MRRGHLALISWMLTVLVSRASGQEAAADKARFQRWLGYYQGVANNYEVFLESDSESKLQVTPKPIMSYSHPAAMRGTHGAFFVWTLRGRPELIGSIWSDEIAGGMRTVMHEFHSLSLEPLSPVKIGRFTWAPETGIELKLIPDAPPPKESAALRLAQMRSLAQPFTGFSTPHGRELRLRTLRQPIFRYESELPEVLDGAIFGMFKEWDPEIMLLIEARKVGDQFVWLLGVGRFNACPMRLVHRDQEVWSVEQAPVNHPAIGDPKSPFFAVHHVDRRPADLENASLINP